MSEESVVHDSCELTNIISNPITIIQQTRLRQIISPDIETIIFKYGFIAGGAVSFMLKDSVPIATVGDIDVFIDNEESFWKCAQEICDCWKEEKAFDRMTSTLKIMTVGEIPIQLIMNNKSMENTILGFDMDYVQCSIHSSPLMTSMSEMCRQSHATGFIQYMCDCTYNAMNLIVRFHKALKKGFQTKREINTVNDIGVQLYDEYKIEFPVYKYSGPLKRFLHTKETIQNMFYVCHSLNKCKTQPLSFFCRENYDKIEEKEIKRNTCQEKQDIFQSRHDIKTEMKTLLLGLYQQESSVSIFEQSELREPKLFSIVKKFLSDRKKYKYICLEDGSKISCIR